MIEKVVLFLVLLLIYILLMGLLCTVLKSSDKKAKEMFKQTTIPYEDEKERK